MSRPSEELKNTIYELFIAALSTLAIINLALFYPINDPIVIGVIIIIDGLLSLIFLGDFLYRLFTTTSKTGYFFRQFGWADLLACIPFPMAKLLRAFRIYRTGRSLGIYSAREMLREFLEDRAQSALLILFFLIILTLEFGGMGVAWTEQTSSQANIRTPGDAVWYTYVTITTVGYGDKYPVTVGGRLVSVIIMTLGVGLFGTLTGYLANAFLAPPKKKEKQITAGGDDPKAKLAQLRQMLDEQKQALIALEDKINEIEVLL